MPELLKEYSTKFPTWFKLHLDSSIFFVTRQLKIRVQKSVSRNIFGINSVINVKLLLPIEMNNSASLHNIEKNITFEISIKLRPTHKYTQPSPNLKSNTLTFNSIRLRKMSRTFFANNNSTQKTKPTFSSRPLLTRAGFHYEDLFQPIQNMGTNIFSQFHSGC
jgi:hypothetical protein